MKRLASIIVVSVLPISLFCDPGEQGIAETLFHHVTDSKTYSPFPYLPDFLLPFGLTVDMLMLAIAAILILAIFIPAFRRPQLKSRGIALGLETIVLFVRDDIVYPIMGEKRGEKWLPFFSTLFVFLLVVNYIGLIPAFKTATGSITVTTALAAMVLAIMLVTGIKQLGIKKFMKNFYPQGTPKPVGLFVAFLEIIGTFIRIVVLSLRLFANMFAGHLAILSFLLLMFVIHPLFGIVAVPFTVFTFTLEVLVALIQALVFTLLSCIFITLASSTH
jgi:F-type H+-transporting ATPase subunit a